MEKEKKKRPLLERLKDRYRLVVLNDSTFEERFALRLSPLNLLVFIGSIAIILTFLVISLVAFSPLREYIPGYGSSDERKQLMWLSNRFDSLEATMEARDWYIKNLNDVFNGKASGKTPKPAKDSTKNYTETDIRPSHQDSLLRQEIEGRDKYSLNISDKSKPVNTISSFFFFSPVKGLVTGSFNLRDAHYGVDITAGENEFIKSTLDGTVVFSGWTNDDGYILHIQHSNNLVSIYKHNSAIVKKTGDYVKAGDPVAVIGNTGETSNGTHLHFELWYNGNPVNPQDYIVF